MYFMGFMGFLKLASGYYNGFDQKAKFWYSVILGTFSDFFPFLHQCYNIAYRIYIQIYMGLYVLEFQQ